MARISHREFQRLVLKALEGIPSNFLARLDNVDVVVNDWPTREDLERTGLDDPHELFGLYHGIPLTERTHDDMALPDRIAIYRRPLESACRTRLDIVEEIRRTVLHELAHHFGIGDAELEQTEYR